MIHVNCPICDKIGNMILSINELNKENDIVKQFYNKRLKDNSDLTDQVNFVQSDLTGISFCNECFVIYRNPVPSPDEIRKRYKHEKYNWSTLDYFLNIYTKFFIKKVRKLKTELSYNNHIIEIGSYCGGFLNACKIEGFKNAIGLDICIDIINFLNSKGFKTSKGSIYDYMLNCKNESIDCIAIWNCFDQLSEPHHDLNAIIRLLKRGGILILRFPNGNLYKFAHNNSLFNVKNRIISNFFCYNNLMGFAFRNGYSVRSILKFINKYNLPLKIKYIEGSQLISVNKHNIKVFYFIEETLYGIFTKFLCPNYTPWLEITLQKI